MTTTTPATTRRSVRSLGRMTQAQASAWMAVHGSEIGGTRGEFDGISTTGTLDHPVMGDGWDTLWWESSRTRPESASRRAHPDRETYERRVAGRRALARRQARQARAAVEAGARQTRARATDQGRLSFASGELVASDAERYEETRPAIQRGRIHLTTVPESFAQVGTRCGYEIASPLDSADRMAGQRARRVAITQTDRFGRLLPDAPLLGQPVARELWFDRRRGYYADQHRRRDMHIADAFAVEDDSEQTSDELVGDTTRVEMIALQDLQELLRSQGVTEREMDALERAALGLPRRDARALMQARARAQRILAGPIHPRWMPTTYSFCWTTVDAGFTTPGFLFS